MGYDKSVYEEVNHRISNMEHCYGPSSILYPGGSNGSRLFMATQNQKQYVTLLNPDIARVQTGHERAFGKYSHAYKELKGEWEVVDKIQKFGDDNVYMLILYNAETDTYDMIEKQQARYIAESFGYQYNTEGMDSLVVGDKTTDPILFKSTSYDEHMNYRLGKNALVAYSNDVATYEDGIKIRRGYLKDFGYVEVGQTTVSINDNDILLFIHGDKSFPDVGEVINDVEILCATRRYNSMYATYDFREKNVHDICNTDNKYCTKLGTVVYDIDVYYNGDEPIPDTIYNAQLIKYYEYCCTYADRVFEAATKIKQSGSHYTDNVTFQRKRFDRYNDPTKKWKMRDKPFSNIVLVFKTKTTCFPKEGCKFVGRYGDKGVVSKVIGDGGPNEEIDKEEFDTFTSLLVESLGIDVSNLNNTHIDIVDDESMYYMEDGTPLDIVLNATGAFRRENTDQLYEVDLNFLAECHRKWITTLDNVDIKMDEILRFIGYINAEQCKVFLHQFRVRVDGDTYVDDKDIKRKIVESVERDGYYFIKSPAAQLRFDAFQKLYKIYADIVEPYQLYVNIFGMKKPLMKKMVVGYKYMLLLKQRSNKNFSARSTGTTSKAGLPTKSSDKKENRICNSNTPVCISEIADLQTQIAPVVLAEHNVWTRTSVLGRKALGKIISATGDPMNIGSFKIKSNYVNDNVLALKARLKVMGIGYKFVTNLSLREDEIANIRQFIKVYGYTFIDAPINRKYYVFLVDRYTRALRDGATPGDPAIFKDIKNSEDFKFLEIPSYIVRCVHDAIYGQYQDMITVSEKEDKK